MSGPARKVTHSVATTSWIDPSTCLPETDMLRWSRNDITPHRDLLLGKKFYRFANFLEGWVLIESGKITSWGFTEDSRLYSNPSSFLGTSPHSYKLLRTSFPTGPGIGRGSTASGIRFWQVAGARTMAPEKLSKALTGTTYFGEPFALPPIWTELVLTIYADGGYDGQLRRFSLFPSVTFFKKSPSGDLYNSTTGYDGRPRLEDWNNRGQGWGAVRNEGYGASFGNPWDIVDPSFGEAYIDFKDLTVHRRGFPVP